MEGAGARLTAQSIGTFPGERQALIPPGYVVQSGDLADKVVNMGADPSWTPMASATLRATLIAGSG